MQVFDGLVEVVRRLREPDGCPWDREQTFSSLLPHILEEAYELAESLRESDLSAMREELGDVLFHVVMLSGMAKEMGVFGILDVVEDVTEKMIRRHPHVFSDAEISTVSEVWENWERIKKEEKKDTGIYASIPKALPSLMRAHKVLKRAERNGSVFSDVSLELQKLKQLCDQDNLLVLKESIGDMLFSIVNIARQLGVDSEEVLKQKTSDFIEAGSSCSTLG
ncbi:MAG: nucleoside triphosphate pyrophosphohydrolase [Candidatus Margulisbacteria bacterium]|nr:nucleoside triphosphate pyrophosphohydrolase [Candidatus Margulisiibacteriota bacterium]